MLFRNINDKQGFKIKSLLFFIGLIFFALSNFQLYAAEKLPQTLKSVGVEERLGEKIPLDLFFYDEDGEKVQLQEFFQDKPVVLSLVYYTCPMLCNLIVTGLTEAYQGLSMTVGDDFHSISISIDKRDTKETTRKFKEKYLSKLKAKKSEADWTFLFSRDDQVEKLAESVGYHYRFDPKTEEYAHTATIFVLSPEGTISRYLYGIEYPEFDMKLSLIEASKNKIFSSVERLLLFCYTYDSNSGGYVLYAVNLMKVAAALTVLAILVMFVVLKRKERNEG